jgi:hypothetical protein
MYILSFVQVKGWSPCRERSLRWRGDSAVPAFRTTSMWSTASTGMACTVLTFLILKILISAHLIAAFDCSWKIEPRVLLTSDPNLASQAFYYYFMLACQSGSRIQDFWAFFGSGSAQKRSHLKDTRVKKLVKWSAIKDHILKDESRMGGHIELTIFAYGYRGLKINTKLPHDTILLNSWDSG